jgi:16S rRNA G1207 methylase RsmC
MPAQTTFSHPWGTLELQRFPVPLDYSLIAFAASDEILLEYIHENGLTDGPIWVLNDSFGALTLSLSSFDVTWIGDNWSAKFAMDENAKRNALPVPKSVWIGDDLGNLAKPSLVIMQIPKENDLLAYELEQIAPYLAPNTPVLATGMTRNIHNSTIQYFEDIIGSTRTSLARKKARMIISQAESRPQRERNLVKQYHDSGSGAVVISNPGVFSSDHPDPGSTNLAMALPEFPEGSRILDVGCGNGYLMASIGMRNPGVELTGCDDSALAVASTKKTLEANSLSGNVYHNHALNDIPESSFDVVVCNPPFHQNHSRHDRIAWDMFQGSKEVLTPEGELWVVGNRNLGYHIQLGRLFRSVDVIASNPTFTVFRCRKS